MRIAIDIDSTLHHYWDVLSRAARDRFGVDLPYEAQITWGITLLKPRQVQACVEDTHRDTAILDATPYPDAVETVRAWREAGHFIHITSHRADSAEGATATWLQQIGLPYDELYCSQDKIARCREIGIDLLVDDSPVNISRAVDAGIAVATISHPWNRDVCEDEDVICAADWAELRAGWRLSWSLRTTRPERRAQLFAAGSQRTCASFVARTPIPPPRPVPSRFPAIPPSRTNLTDERRRLAIIIAMALAVLLSGQGSCTPSTPAARTTSPTACASAASTSGA